MNFAKVDMGIRKYQFDRLEALSGIRTASKAAWGENEKSQYRVVDHYAGDRKEQGILQSWKLHQGSVHPWLCVQICGTEVGFSVACRVKAYHVASSVP